MPYSILDPLHPDGGRRNLCALTIMAKAPRPGRVKTRLSPPLTPEEAAALNIAFLRDTTQKIAALTQTSACAGVVSYTPVGDEHLFEGLLPATFQLMPQRGDAFGERLLTTAQDLLSCGFGSVCLIDSDSPTVPSAALRTAVEALRLSGERVVLGPSNDGGYYLIGMKRPYPELFEQISWSTGSVAEQTERAVQSLGLELVNLPLWYDVDDAATLALLRAELLEGIPPAFTSVPGHAAERTGALLRTMEGGA